MNNITKLDPNRFDTFVYKYNNVRNIKMDCETNNIKKGNHSEKRGEQLAHRLLVTIGHRY